MTDKCKSFVSVCQRVDVCVRRLDGWQRHRSEFGGTNAKRIETFVKLVRSTQMNGMELIEKDFYSE